MEPRHEENREEERGGDDEQGGEWIELLGEEVKYKLLNSAGSGLSAEIGVVVECSDLRMFRLHSASAENIVNEDDEEEVKGGHNDYRELIDEFPSLRAEIGQGDVVPGLELALRSCRVGDNFCVRVSPKFAYGFETRVPLSVEMPSLPAHSTVEFEGTVTRHTTPAMEFPSSASKQCLYSALLRKEAGNRWFQFKEYLRAGRAYSAAAQMADTFLIEAAKERGDNNEDEEKGKEEERVTLSEISRVLVDALNNLAASHLSNKEFFKAKETCVRVLETDPSNTKVMDSSV